MSKRFKYKDNNYLDSTGIVHNKEILKDILDSQIISFNSSGLPKTETTAETTILSSQISKGGIYLFTANIPVNYYGQTGRDLVLKFYVNDSMVWANTGVINTSAWTLSASLAQLVKIKSDSTIKITIQDKSGKSYAIGAFFIYCLRLK